MNNTFIDELIAKQLEYTQDSINPKHLEQIVISTVEAVCDEYFACGERLAKSIIRKNSKNNLINSVEFMHYLKQQCKDED